MSGQQPSELKESAQIIQIEMKNKQSELLLE